jgi:lipopolysaccharide biosynthesis glycosyltransferase
MQHAMISILSISKLIKNEKITIYIIHSNLDPRSIAILKRFLKFIDAESFIIKVQNDFIFIKKNNFTSHLNASMFLRLYAPYVLKCEKVLYLDCDTIVKDIKRLKKLYYKSFFYKNNLCALMASADPENSMAIKLFNKNIMNTSIYFNSGVLMMNLKLMRNVSLQDILYFYNKNENNLPFPDQDIINYFFNAQIKPLLPIYNALNNGFNYAYSNNKLSKKTQTILRNNIVIKHFFGKLKPWKIVTFHNKEYFFLYLFLCKKKILKLQYCYVALGFITMGTYPLLKILIKCLKKVLR